MKVKFYKIPVLIHTAESAKADDLDIEIDTNTLDEGVIYLFKDAAKSLSLYWNNVEKYTEITAYGGLIGVSPLLPKEIMNLKLIEYDGQ